MPSCGPVNVIDVSEEHVVLIAKLRMMSSGGLQSALKISRNVGGGVVVPVRVIRLSVATSLPTFAAVSSG